MCQFRIGINSAFGTGCTLSFLAQRDQEDHSSGVNEVKDTLRAVVRIGFDGKVYKTFRGPKAEERFANEARVLQYLSDKKCPFVPVLLDADAEKLRIITTNCGSRVDYLDTKRMAELFAELERYGVRHEDQAMRNVTYRQSDGRFCLIDFEFAKILEGNSCYAADK